MSKGVQPGSVELGWSAHGLELGPRGGMEGGFSPVLAPLPPPPQAASQVRQQHLSTLQDYMQRCTNELYWLDQQAKGRMQYDWSDRNLDYPSRRRQYEVGLGQRGQWGRQGAQGCQLGAEPPPLPPLQNFINRNLEAKEERINKLHSEGDQLLAAEHPGRNSIEVGVPGGGCLHQGGFRVASAVGR